MIIKPIKLFTNFPPQKLQQNFSFAIYQTPFELNRAIDKCSNFKYRIRCQICSYILTRHKDSLCLHHRWSPFFAYLLFECQTSRPLPGAIKRAFNACLIEIFEAINFQFLILLTTCFGTFFCVWLLINLLFRRKTIQKHSTDWATFQCSFRNSLSFNYHREFNSLEARFSIELEFFRGNFVWFFPPSYKWSLTSVNLIKS